MVTSGVAKGMEKGQRPLIFSHYTVYCINVYIFSRKMPKMKRKRHGMVEAQQLVLFGVVVQQVASLGSGRWDESPFSPFIPLSLSECLKFLIDKSST